MIISCVFLAVVLPILETKEVDKIARFDSQLKTLLENRLSTLAACMDENLGSNFVFMFTIFNFEIFAVLMRREMHNSVVSCFRCGTTHQRYQLFN